MKLTAHVPAKREHPPEKAPARVLLKVIIPAGITFVPGLTSETDAVQVAC
jgi:hypothetical protein